MSSFCCAFEQGSSCSQACGKGITSSFSRSLSHSSDVRNHELALEIRSLVVEPLVVEHPTLHSVLDRNARGLFDGLELPDQVSQITILLPHSWVVLTLFEDFNVGKFGLEGKSVTHLIEQKG